MNERETPSRSFLCIPHGVTDWNREGRFQGRTDVPLNDEGIGQARAAARRPQSIPFDHIVSGPLIRAVRTAEIIAAARTSIALDADLIECDFGSPGGRPIREVMQEHGITQMAGLATILPADGEAWASVSERAGWTDLHKPTSVRLP